MSEQSRIAIVANALTRHSIAYASSSSAVGGRKTRCMCGAEWKGKAAESYWDHRAEAVLIALADAGALA